MCRYVRATRGLRVFWRVVLYYGREREATGLAHSRLAEMVSRRVVPSR
jgi:hypothetical protein